MKYLLTVTLIIVGLTASATAQMLPFRTYSIENGLSQAVVNDLMQDQDGYLWAATNFGLNRFDGLQFKNYYAEDGLLDNSVHSLYEDESGRIWIGTGGGVNFIKSDSIHTHPVLQPLQQSTILAIYQDSRDVIWFATDGEGVWNLDHDELTQYQEGQGLGDNRVRAITEDEAGVVWFATRSGLSRFDSGRFQTFTSKQGLPDDRLRDVVVKDSTALWVASRGGLCEFAGNQFTCLTEDDGLVNNRIQSLSLDKQGNVWLGTEEGASFYSGDQFTNFSVDEGLANNIIYSTQLDREGNIWFGTYGGGMSLFMGSHFQNYTVEEGLPNNVVTSITEDRDGKFWVATFGGGVAQLSGNDLMIFNEQRGLINNKVYTVVNNEQNDRLIFGTHWGLSIYDYNSFNNYDQDELESRKIRTVMDPKQSEGYWLGTYGNGVLHYHNGEFITYTEEEGLVNNTVLSSTEADDGAIWFATYGGVSRWSQGNFYNYTIRDGLPNNGVLDVFKDQSGRIWASTFGGIAVLNEETDAFEAITPADGLPDEVCYFMEQDDSGIFWIGSNKGVIRFDYQRYLKEGRAAGTFQLFTQDQGLVANEMNTGASFKDRQGNLWFGSVGGLTKFNPALLETGHTAPKVHIEDLSVAGESTPLKSELEISSDNHNIIFSFIGLNFSAPEQVTYQYRLKNFTDQWQHTDQRSVRYSALMPGEYTFQVRAQGNNGQWSNETAQVSFIVQAPFWLQWWFITLVILSLVGIIFFIYNYYRAKKMIEIERMRVRIASDLHDDVGSALTEIALQSDFLQTMDVDDSLQESLRQMGSQSRKVVSSLDDIVWSIDARNDTMGDLTDRMQDYVNSVLPQRKINYHFEGNMQEKLEVSLKENLYLIFKEAINNISKHSNADTIDITLSTDGRGYLMSIKDNGDSAQKKRKSGQGLRNMNMRAKRIDADISFSNTEGFEVRVESST